MGLLPKEQTLDQIKKSETVLICVGKNPDGDALGSALGLCLALKKMGKKADIVSPTAILNKYSFLPSADTITHKLEGVRDYILSLDIDKEKLHQLRYEVQNNKLKIFITAKNSDLEEKDIVIESARFKYDLVIILGTSDLENLGSIYDENSDLFYEAPVVNIDHNPSNEYFGKINLVDVTASSTSEIIFNLIIEIKEELIDEQIATNLLEGIIFKTNSFQNKNTTPKAFLAAASLIAKGANKQEIIRYLYKTKSISTLKLMGKIMSNLKYNGKYKLGWSILPNGDDDFIKTNASPEKLSLAVKELADSSPEFDLVLLIYKIDGKINGIMNFSEKMQVNDLVKSVDGKVEDNQIIFVFNETETESAEKNILQKIKEWTNETDK